jgi:cytochrome c553
MTNRSGTLGSGIRRHAPARAITAAAAALMALACNQTPQRSAGTADTTAQAPAVETRDDLLLMAAKVALPPPGVMPADLPNPNAQAAKDMVTYCTSCHDLPTPLLHSSTDWPGVIRRMWLRMDRLPARFAVPVPDAGQRFIMQQYLIENALKVSGATLPAGPSKGLFETTCSRCHELPDPRQHAAPDWVAVVERMSLRMRQMLGQPLDQADVTRIALYLESVSKQSKQRKL